MDIATIPSKNMLYLRSALYILTGVALLAWPAATVIVILFLIAVNIFLSGMFLVFEPLVDKTSKSSVLSFLLGLVSIIFGVYLMSNPGVTASLAVLFIALWALIFGVADLYVGLFGKNKGVGGSWLLVLAGLASFVFGIYMLFNPLITTLTLVWVAGLYNAVVGILLFIFVAFSYPKTKNAKK